MMKRDVKLDQTSIVGYWPSIVVCLLTLMTFPMLSSYPLSSAVSPVMAASRLAAADRPSTPSPAPHVMGRAETEAILRRADQSRGNQDGISWEVALKTVKPGKNPKSVAFDVKAREFDILAENLFPPKSKGNRVLMLNGNMWFHKPGLSKPVPISRRQKLLGQAAYGDIASTNYAEDYEATLLGEGNVNGEACYVFDLKSKNKNTTYDRIKYWISKSRAVGIKAEYYTVSGKRFKSSTMDYGHHIQTSEIKRPFISRITIQDELASNNKTIMHFQNPDLEELTNRIFNLNLFMK